MSSSYAKAWTLYGLTSELAESLYQQFVTEDLFSKEIPKVDFSSIEDMVKATEERAAHILSGDYPRKFQLEDIEKSLSSIVYGLHQSFSIDYTILFLVEYKKRMEIINQAILSLGCSKIIIKLGTELESSLSKLILMFRDLNNK